jgi:type II secretory pathway pseudopilin PulG
MMAAMAIAIVAIVVLGQRQAKSNGEIARLQQEGRALQEENENLRQQIAQVQAATPSVSRPAGTATWPADGSAATAERGWTTPRATQYQGT